MEEDRFDLATFLPYLLTQAAETSSLGFQRLYKDRYGMLRTEWRVLFHLGRYGAMRASEVCRRARIHKTKVSRAVAALERRRFLTRAEDPADRRLETLSLPAAGQAAFDDLCREAQSYDARRAAAFSDEEIATLRRCLTQLSGGADQRR